ncbi:hypothetical protein RJ640_001541 [Escallonia rubra]|uniref:Reverse transcriptase Ty1/copia-type domain-containing protein n=1 Tax=Escallonia rubra TaxID=112253 RepID=A0AA88RSB7_9ASTE|nr:hypothetical protein RJ640_001541 [Escallonia rubra]
METIKMVLALANQLKLLVYQSNQHFWTVKLKKRSMSSNHKAISSRQEDKVYWLSKALYGLKQAPRAWNTKIDNPESRRHDEVQLEDSLDSEVELAFEVQSEGCASYYGDKGSKHESGVNDESGLDGKIGEHKSKVDGSDPGSDTYCVIRFEESQIVLNVSTLVMTPLPQMENIVELRKVLRGIYEVIMPFPCNCCYYSQKIAQRHNTPS